MASPSNTESRCTLKKLAPEIRLKIYAHVLNMELDNQAPGLLLALASEENKELYYECGDIRFLEQDYITAIYVECYL